MEGGIYNICFENASLFNESLEYDDYEYVPFNKRLETYIIPLVFSLILIVGVVGNGILILILLCNSNMRNIPNIYVLSLAWGDLLVIVTCVPFTSIVYTFESWPWGTSICKLSEFAKDISIGVSVFTLAALSAERYCAIVNPIRHHVANLSAKRLTILTTLLIWILAIVLAMPAVLFSHVMSIPIFFGNCTNYVLICNPYPEEYGEGYKKGIVMFKFLIYYAIPLCVIAGFYLGMARHLTLSTRNIPSELTDYDHQQIRARKKVGKMVVCFIIIFVVCFLPYHVFMLWFHFCPTSLDNYNDFWHILRMVGFCLSFSNSCVNPIALYLISRTFRQRFNKYLFYCLPSDSAICGRDQMKKRIRSNGSYSVRNRGNVQGTLYETSFGSTFRKRTQELNSTGVFEMGSIETTRPIQSNRNSLSRNFEL